MIETQSDRIRPGKISEQSISHISKTIKVGALTTVEDLQIHGMPEDDSMRCQLKRTGIKLLCALTVPSYREKHLDKQHRQWNSPLLAIVSTPANVVFNLQNIYTPLQ